MVTRRWAAVLVAVLTLLALAAPGAAAAPSATTRQASDDAITWLIGQNLDGLTLAERLHLALALEVAGAPASHVDRQLDALAFVLGQGEPADVQALAQAIIVFDAAGRSTTVDGRDLVAELRANLGIPPAAQGQYTAPDADVVAHQAWGILAEARVGGRITEQVAYLVSRQCPSGKFVTTPTVTGCVPHVDGRAQAFALQALVAARSAGLDVAAALSAGVGWYDDEGGAELSATRSIPASSLSWFASPLAALGRTDAVTEIESQLLGLQLTAADGRSALVGAIGGESPHLRDQMLAAATSPSPWLSADAVLGWAQVDLTTFTYQPRSALASLPEPEALLASVGEATAGDTVEVLAQGFAPQEEVTLTIVGTAGTAARATTDAEGRAVLSFTARSLVEEEQRLAVTSATGQVANGDLTVVAGEAAQVGTSGGVIDMGAEPWPPVTLAVALLAGAATVGVLIAGAWVTRERV